MNLGVRRFVPNSLSRLLLRLSSPSHCPLPSLSSSSTTTSGNPPFPAPSFGAPIASSSPSSSSTTMPLLVVTQRAADQLHRIAGPGEHLRISVDSGGCSGFEYKLTLDNRLDEREDEVVKASDGATVVVDKLSLEFLRGSTIDFAEDLMRSAFRITDNPQATQGCSCGASFAPKNQLE